MRAHEHFPAVRVEIAAQRRRLRLSPEARAYLETEGLVVCEDCLNEGEGERSCWKPPDPQSYYEWGDAISLCPFHLKASGMHDQMTSFELWLRGMRAESDGDIAGRAEEPLSRITHNRDVHLGRKIGAWFRRLRMIDEHEKGTSAAEIARQMGTSRRTVERAYANGRESLRLTEREDARYLEHQLELYGCRDADELKTLYVVLERAREAVIDCPEIDEQAVVIDAPGVLAKIRTRGMDDVLRELELEIQQRRIDEQDARIAELESECREAGMTDFDIEASSLLNP